MDLMHEVGRERRIRFLGKLSRFYPYFFLGIQSIYQKGAMQINFVSIKNLIREVC